LALDEPSEKDIRFDVEGMHFSMDQGLERLVNMYGRVLVDYQKRQWFGEGFKCRLKMSSGGCC